MASAPLKLCAAPGCPALVKSGRCAIHAKQSNTQRFRAYDDRRGSSTARGYDSSWYKFLDSYRRGVDIPDEDPQWAEKITARNVCVCGCGERSALEFDHIIPLEHGGARLDPANIQPMCRRSHASKTAADKQKYARGQLNNITLVCGPPCSGKTTYVREHMQSGDLVIDLDAILQALSFADDPHAQQASLLPFAWQARDAVLDRLAARPDRPQHTWIIDSAASQSRRLAITQRFSAAVVCIDTARDVCLERAAQRPDPTTTIEAINRWFREAGSAT